MKTLMIINPWANRGGADRHFKQMQTLCQQHDIELLQTEKSGDARRFARDAANNGYGHLIAAGGDGTVNEVVNGICDADPATKPRLGIVPMGSGNDLAYALGIADEPVAALTQFLQGKPLPIDLARIETNNGRSLYADNNLGLGFDARVVIASETMRHYKILGGFMLYFAAVLRTLFFEFDMMKLSVTYDQTETVTLASLFLALGVGPRGGGGFMLNPLATHTDNRVDSCLVKEISRPLTFKLLPKAINGRHITSKHVIMRQSQHLSIHSDAPMPIHVDGEVFARLEDNVTQVTIESVPAAIEVMV